MQTKPSFRKAVTIVGMMAILAGVGSGCVATRKFTRNHVDQTAQELSADLGGRIDSTEQSTENNSNWLNAHTGQIEELGTVTREHSEQLSQLDGELAEVDQKGQQALTVGQGAQMTAEDAVRQVSSLGARFDSRHNYITMSEERVLFGFDSA